MTRSSDQQSTSSKLRWSVECQNEDHRRSTGQENETRCLMNMRARVCALVCACVEKEIQEKRNKPLKYGDMHG